MISANNRKKTTVIVILVLIAALALGSLSALAGLGGGSGSGNDAAADVDSDSGSGSEDLTSEQKQQLLSLQRRDAGDPMAMGEKDAPVTLIEYSDFQCPFCGKFARDTKPELVKKYVDKGVLRIEWRNFPIFGGESEASAKAGWAAGQQGRFWQFHDLAYGKERKKNSGEFAEGKLIAMAEEAGVKDIGKFKKDMDSKAAAEAVQQDSVEGQNLGVTSTPAFLINSTPVLGAQPTEVFTEMVEEARKAAEAKKQ
ncbi:DsbA family protein [Streptomyces sp. A7024]|uniref:DsbA family protein n=1 Tax=Streptomyces coryli TaxID=1128680 RepID=A0A6G4TZY2_9ACTN|nr:DsbA family protein [Streptomyces coryli]